MAEATVSFLLENVTQLLTYYRHLITGAEAELEQLKKDLEILKGFLRDAARRPKKQEAFKAIERQVREVVYEAEDVIDTGLSQTAAKGKKFFRSARSLNRINLAEEVKSLREGEVKKMVDTVRDFVMNEIGQGPNTNTEEPRSRVSKLQPIRQENIVGFKDEEEMIIRYLQESKEELDVISIIGMPGLGKTTLAWKIFKDENIHREFPNRIWVYVSQTMNSRDVFLNILKEFTSEDVSGLSDHDLAQTVRQHLEKKKFLLVLDDVWTVQAWKDIQFVLTKSNSMGKVLITSREKNVGAHACHTRKPLDLRFLTGKESWELLQYEVFGKLDNCPNTDLELIGECIALQCDGLPLAIVVIGGVLVDQFMTVGQTSAIIEAWNKVSRNVSMFLENDKEQRISDIVAFSYNRLPDDLRGCFLYLGVFPEDYEIPAWALTRLWIAEGFIQYKKGQSMEAIAEENLKDLINRNLVMVDKTNPKGEVKTCRVHDVIHAFCSSKASVQEQNLFQEVKVSNGTLDPPISDIHKYRRLCIHSDLGNFLARSPKTRRIRSFLCFNKAPAKLPSDYTATIPDAFDLLRVLDSKSVKLEQIPTRLTKLFHLRYITLSVDSLCFLPEAISDLWNLQTLVVITKSDSLKAKANIWKMTQLRHLKTKAAIILDTRLEGNDDQNLQTLSRLSPECCTEDVLKRAHSLKRLGIRGKLSTLFNTKTLGRLKHLEKLKLVNTIDESASKDLILFPELTSWFPPSLETLTISATSLEWKHMSTLGKIDTLQVLKLKDNAFIGMSWDVVGGSFCNLHFLLIEKADLFSWKASTDSFPSLTCLVLKNCLQLKEIPKVLVKSLEKLEIEHLGKSAVASARKIEEEKKRNQVTPEVARFGGGFKLFVGPGCV